ncbi:uncharacterized protein LOC124321089 [Daphnia pulicaria]|uniref:uncharacterized protein LOC124321089 n=1 Tax=Daphnia pulicaria TaxID=35523 RepID=UPI001EE9BEB1|nr:uncharacterized protein LOC124321089 [Daphnia pulicaria]
MATGTFSAKDVSHITKFKGDQFSFYKFQLKLVLKNHALLKIVEGDEQKPAAIVLLADNSNNAAVIARNTQIDEWDKKDTAAQNYIVATLEEKVMRTIMNYKTSNSMWIRLLNQYELASVENKHLLMSKFMAYQYDPTHDIMSHVSAVESLASQLSDVNSPISNDQIMAKITSTLPLNGNRNYRSFMSAWNSTDDAIKTLSILTSRLQVEENMLKLTDMSVDSSDGAFFAGKKKNKVVFSESKSRDFSSHDRPKPVCGHCRNLNRRASHREEDCWIKEAYLKGRQDAGSEEAMLAQLRKEKTTAPGYDDYAFKSADLQLNNECWYADSGASEHMSDQKSIFQSITPINRGDRAIKSVGKNNEALYATGVGNVIIKTKVNGEWHDGLLRNVLFVPDLGANLFSIGATTERGATATFDKNGMELRKNGKIVATGSRMQKLYLMHFANCSSSGKIEISRDVIFNESIQAPSLLPVAVPRTDLETVSVIGVGGDAYEASNGRATVSNDQCGQPASDTDIIAEPFHGFEQPEKPLLGDHHLEPSVDSPQRPSRIRKKPNRVF